MNKKYIKGFCPSLRRPIFASDGLLVRLRFILNTIESEKLKSLCDLSRKYGSGLMELTNRGSLQIRGIKKINHENFIEEIFKNKILEHEDDGNINTIINPFWTHEDQNYKIYKILAKYKVPNLPEKFGLLLDLGKIPCLKNISGDIRIENSRNNKILVRAEGSEKGKVVNFNEINDFVLNMIEWFMNYKKKSTNRMGELLLKKKLPDEWCQEIPIKTCYDIFPSNTIIGQIFGIKLGRFFAKDLKNLLLKSKSPRVRLTPFKMIILENVKNFNDENFISDRNDPFLNLSACSGKDYCTNSSINTFKLAKKIKGKTKLKVHVTGCEKNCGMSKETQILLSGTKNYINFFDFRSKNKTNSRKKLSYFSKKFFKGIE